MVREIDVSLTPSGYASARKGVELMVRLIVAWASVVAIFALLGVEQWNYIQFDRGCGGYLKRAADSNSVDLAKGNLDRAVRYMRGHDLTHGYTSIFYRTPDEDIGFWYQNVRSALDQLIALPANATELEKSNMLLKLRETLLDHDSDGESVTVPSGIALYPDNALFGILAVGLLCCALMAFAAYFFL